MYPAPIPPPARKAIGSLTGVPALVSIDATTALLGCSPPWNRHAPSEPYAISLSSPSPPCGFFPPKDPMYLDTDDISADHRPGTTDRLPIWTGITCGTHGDGAEYTEPVRNVLRPSVAGTGVAMLRRTRRPLAERDFGVDRSSKRA